VLKARTADTCAPKAVTKRKAGWPTFAVPRSIVGASAVQVLQRIHFAGMDRDARFRRRFQSPLDQVPAKRNASFISISGTG
jgi:hypothetical protein